MQGGTIQGGGGVVKLLVWTTQQVLVCRPISHMQQNSICNCTTLFQIYHAVPCVYRSLRNYQCHASQANDTMHSIIIPTLHKGLSFGVGCNIGRA